MSGRSRSARVSLPLPSAFGPFQVSVTMRTPASASASRRLSACPSSSRNDAPSTVSTAAVLPAARAASTSAIVRACASLSPQRSSSRSSTDCTRRNRAQASSPRTSSGMNAAKHWHQANPSVRASETWASLSASVAMRCAGMRASCAAKPPGTDASPWNASRSSVSQCRSNTRRRSAGTASSLASRTASSSVSPSSVMNKPIAHPSSSYPGPIEQKRRKFAQHRIRPDRSRSS